MTYTNDDLKRCVLEWVLADWHLPALLEQFYRFADSVQRRMTAAHHTGELVVETQAPEPVADPDVAALVDRSLWERMSQRERDEKALSCIRDMMDMADWSYVAVPAVLEG